MRNILQLLDRALFGAIALLLIVMVVDVSWQVFARYILGDPPAWTEEVARYIFTWQIFLGAALAFGRGSHIVVDALMAMLSPKASRVVAALSYLASMALMIPLVKFGFAMAELTSNTWAAASGVNIGAVYAALPVGAAIGLFYLVLNLVHVVRGGNPVRAEASTMVD
ncbi:MAG: TRAP transporter small permease [Rhizobiales bacterium]|nr:TRAP transporter small permease [Hyphomicrobiales bacterium]